MPPSNTTPIRKYRNGASDISYLKYGHIIIGHTSQDKINSKCNNKIWRIDTAMSRAFDNIKLNTKPINWIKRAADHYYVSSRYEYDDNFFQYHKRLDVEGYFQAEKYFYSIKKNYENNYV